MSPKDMSIFDQTTAAIERAKALVKLRRYAESKVVLEKALLIAPDDGDLIAELARSHYHLADYDPALQLIDRALGIKVAAWMYRVRGMILTALCRIDDTIEAVEKAIELAPDLGAHHAALAKALRMDRRAEAALAAARRAVELDPESTFVLRELGQCAFDVGDLELAIKCARRVLELAPDESSYHSNLAEMLVAASRIDEALHVLRNAVARNPTDLWLLMQLAIELDRAGHQEESRRVEDGAVRLAGRKFDNWSDLGAAAESREDRARAEKYFARAHQLKPSDPDSAASYATFLDDHNVGLEALERAIAKAPTHQQLTGTKLSLLKQLGRWDEAIETATAYYEKTQRVEPLISALASAGRLDELARYEPVLEQTKDGHDKYEEQGNIALARGQWTLAEEKFRLVLKDGSSCCCSWAGLGVALCEQGRREEAQACERAVAKHSWTCRCVMGNALRKRLEPS